MSKENVEKLYDLEDKLNIPYEERLTFLMPDYIDGNEKKIIPELFEKYDFNDNHPQLNKVIDNRIKELQLQLEKQQDVTAEKPITNKNLSKEKNTMSNWTKPTAKEKEPQKEPQKEFLAYINKDTQTLAKENPEVDALANKLLDSAKEIMDKVSKEGLTTQSKNYKTKEFYTDKMVVNVEPAENKEDGAPITTKDGDPVYQATARLSHNNTTITLYANQAGEFTSILAMKKVMEMVSDKISKPKFYPYSNDDIAKAPIDETMKSVAALIRDEGFIKENLRSFCIEANQYFSANSEKIPNENGLLVNNAYAKHVDGDYGEKVCIYNHTDNVVVELGETKEGKAFAVAVNYDLNSDFEPRQKGETPARVFINNKEDLENYISLPEIKDIISDYKNFDGKEAEKEATQKKEQAER